MIRALIVDDEAPARQRLRDLLSGVEDLELVAECPDGPSALEVLEAERPDLLFLDVQMPEMDGLELLGCLHPEERPAVIFVTAFDQHAVAAFDERALDYLLKPFTEDRFLEALERARERLARPDPHSTAAIDEMLEGRGPPERLPVREEGCVRFMAVDEIRWLEADGNYVILHGPSGVHRVRSTLKGLAQRLAPAGFIRIHQSYVVNRDHIRELQPWTHGEFAVVLDDGTSLVSSRTYSDELRKMAEL